MCVQLHTQVHVVVVVIVIVFTLLKLVFSNVCFECDIILMFFVVNEREHDGIQDRGYDKFRTKW
jgi:hypothetical protein